MIVEIFRLTCSSCHQSPCLQLLPLTSLRDRLSVPAPAPYSCKRATTSHLEPDKSIRPLPASCYSCSAAISLNSINLLLLTTFSPSGLPLLCDMCSFLQKKKDIYEEFQSGFRPHHSTVTALVKITNDLLLASDQGYILLLVLLDLSAAFDTIDHDILIDRLQNYTGIHGQALIWF